jgi:hypothetical protein
MNKLIFPNSQPNLLADTAAQFSVIDFDKPGMIKDACHGNKKIAALISDLKPDKDHFLGHFIALGDHEHYGYNRNGDTFTKQACIDHVDTFVKHGHYFREHKNQDPKYKIGDIKAASYNEDMGRIEVIVWGDKKLAEEQFEKAASGKPLNCSMACNVKYDVSSITGKKQASLDEYDQYCKYRLGQYIPEMKKYAFVYNPEPKWFDLSDVANNADRIAYHLNYEFDNNPDLQKAASATRHVSSAELAEKFGVRDLGFDEVQTGCKNTEKQIMLQKLADAESYINLLREQEGNVCKDEKFHFVKQACQNSFSKSAQLEDSQIQVLKKLYPASVLNLMAKRAAFLPFTSFCALFTHDDTVENLQNDPVIKYANCGCDDLFSKMLGSPISQIEQLFDPGSEFELSSDSGCGDDVQSIMDSVEDKFSIKTTPLNKRVMSISIADVGDDGLPKAASSDDLTNDQKDEAFRLMLAYGHYKVATAKKINELYGQNFIDSPQALLLVSQHNSLT